ncbi:hypothetical protein EV360DRAFT_72187 [Lentinula raphanica]|nr:hypothetical protein EV360DRAFT_72187 [Lentinula raphanica]
MSRATDSKSPPQERLQQPQLQSEPSQSAVGTFFSNARNFDISGGAFNHANRDMHHTINNDHSTKSDFNNNYSGATRYNGAHNDYRQIDGVRIIGRFSDNFKGPANYNGRHEDFRGSTNNAYLSDQQQAYRGNDPTKRAASPLKNQHPGYAGPYAQRINDHGFENRDAGWLDGNAHGGGSSEPLPSYEPNESANEFRDRPGNKQTYLDSFLESQRDFQMDIQTQHERSSSRQGPDQKDQEPPSPAEAEGVAQLRQCVQKFLATYIRGGNSDMSDLADVLIKAGWDREAVAESEWNDIKDQYRGNGWKAPVFVKLRAVCKGWKK